MWGCKVTNLGGKEAQKLHRISWCGGNKGVLTEVRLQGSEPGQQRGSEATSKLKGWGLRNSGRTHRGEVHLERPSQLFQIEVEPHLEFRVKCLVFIVYFIFILYCLLLICRCLWFIISCLSFIVYCLVFSVSCSGFRVQGLGLRV